MLLSGAGQGLVLGGEDAEVLAVALCPLEDLVRGEVRTLVGEHAGEHLAGALLGDRAVVSCGGIRVEARVDVEHVGLAPAVAAT